ncbi:PAS domain-containing protein [Bacillus sp. JJ1521]|uniref:helix-turn-helix transcriptional regulator n=1 Tax=Bacillus sp. JJ1521 TaxID=3122957 RepID=UPI002FFF5A58
MVVKKSASELLQNYIPLVEFLGSVMGQHCEVVLHDIRNLESSIIAIKNNHISNRNVGGSITDLALKILKEKSYANKDFLINYAGKTQEGKIVKSSTFFIKDLNEEVIGLLCFNMDVGCMIETKNLLDNLINGSSQVGANGLQLNGRELGEPCDTFEDLHTSIEDLTTSIILKTLSEVEVPPERMSPDEKMEIVSKLNERGVFLIKGAVSEVAANLKSSDATIYRYLQKIDIKY